MKKIIALSIWLLIAVGCRKEEEKRGWWTKVHFVDSTYTRDESEYKIGEKIYVLGCESFTANMPDTVNIVIKSGIGDYEIVKAYPQGVIVIPEIRDHGGYISTKISDSFIQMNGIIEVPLSGDTLWAIYTVKKIDAMDTCYITQK